MPLPTDRDTLLAGAALGREVAALLDPETPVAGVTTGRLRPELMDVARLGTTVRRTTPDLALTARWGCAGQGGVTMPGPVKTEIFHTERAPDPAALWIGELALREETVRVFLNATTFWDDVPRAVWDTRSAVTPC